MLQSRIHNYFGLAATHTRFSCRRDRGRAAVTVCIESALAVRVGEENTVGRKIICKRLETKTMEVIKTIGNFQRQAAEANGRQRRKALQLKPSEMKQMEIVGKHWKTTERRRSSWKLNVRWHT